jgi:hypothetical protein
VVNRSVVHHLPKEDVKKARVHHQITAIVVIAAEAEQEISPEGRTKVVNVLTSIVNRCRLFHQAMSQWQFLHSRRK